ncbi:hypothetical protein HZ326_25492, partial [Fusarium oxysporum f. sp. albedinis]
MYQHTRRARISPTSLGHGRGLDRMSKESKPLKSPTPVARRPVLSYSMPLPSVTYKAGHGLGSTVCIDDYPALPYRARASHPP